MKDLKNILPQVEFKKIYENIQIEKNELFSKYKLNEDMDFSNNVGWSKSVKIFSFAAKYVEYAKLGILKKQLDNEFRKAVLVAIDLMQLSIKEQETLSFDDAFNGLLEYSSEVSIETNTTTTHYVERILNLEKEQKETYKEIYELELEIVKYKYEKTYKKSVQDAQTAKTTQNDTNNDKIIIFKKGNTYEENLKNQIATINSLFGKLESDDLKTNNNSGMLAVISKKLEKEINTINDDTAKNALIKFKNDIDSKIKALPQSSIEESEYNQRKDSYIGKITSNSDSSKSDILKKMNDLWLKIELYYNGDNKHIKHQDDKTKEIYHKIAKLIHPNSLHDKNLTFDDLKNRLKEASKLSKEFKLNENLKLLFNQYMKLFEKRINEKFEKIFEDTDPKALSQNSTNTDLVPVQNKSNLPAQIQGQENDDELAEMKNKMKILKEKIVKFTESISMEQKESLTTTVNQKVTIKQTIKLNENDRKNKNVSSAYEKYKDSGNFDCEQIMKLLTSDDDKKKFIKIVIDNVNNETLKVIALKAVALYNPEYGQAKEGIYSRVNFRTTDADRTKIENKWLKMISQVKAKYMLCFSLNGSFPESIDPIGLMNSDKDLREKFKEYGDQAKDKVAKTKTKDDNLNTPDTSTCQLKNLGIETNQIAKYGIFVINNKSDKNSGGALGILVKKENYDGIVTYIVLEYYYWDKVIDDIICKDDETIETNKINDILIKYKIPNNINDDSFYEKMIKLIGINETDKKRIIFFNNAKIKVSVANPFILSSIINNKQININHNDKATKELVEETLTDKNNVNLFFKLDNIFNIKDVKPWNKNINLLYFNDDYSNIIKNNKINIKKNMKKNQ